MCALTCCNKQGIVTANKSCRGTTMLPKEMKEQRGAVRSEISALKLVWSHAIFVH